MRKIAVIAMFAIVAAMVPMSTAGSQPTPGSLDGVGTLMVINSFRRPRSNLVIEVDDGEVVVFFLDEPRPGGVPGPGRHPPFRVCSPTWVADRPELHGWRADLGPAIGDGPRRLRTTSSTS